MTSWSKEQVDSFIRQEECMDEVLRVAKAIDPARLDMRAFWSVENDNGCLIGHVARDQWFREHYPDLGRTRGIFSRFADILGVNVEHILTVCGPCRSITLPAVIKRLEQMAGGKNRHLTRQRISYERIIHLRAA